MVFSSLSFLYLFLPLCAVLYYAGRNRVWRNCVLLAFSLGFYAWGEPKNIALLLLASFAAYVGGLWMERLRVRGHTRGRRAVFAATVALLTANLFVFKYLNFFCGNLEGLLGRTIPVPQIALPIGISFYTFQILSYVIDLYLGKIGLQRNFFYLTLYVSFFPQLIAGPIVRYQTVEEEIINRRESLEDVVSGAKRFILGLAKKVIIADNMGSIAELIYRGDPQVYGSLMLWAAAGAYALQIYFDFSGYSDMAIGLGRMFGFHFLENFNYPYISRSITEFWRRWHISLSTWFRDYIYIPLGGSRVKKSRWVLNLLAVWALTGFWHGAQWNFLLWGLYYGVLLLVEKLFLGRFLEKWPKALQWAYTMFLVLVGWVLFNVTDLGRMAEVLGTMFGFVPTRFVGMFAADTSIARGLIYVPLGLLFSAPVLPGLKKRWARLKEGGPAARTAALAAENAGCALLLTLCVIYIISASYNYFIYFRF